jgi:hypothetical protein
VVDAGSRNYATDKDGIATPNIRRRRSDKMSAVKGVCENIAVIEDGTSFMAEGFADVQDGRIKSMIVSLSIVYQRTIDKPS